MRELVKLELHFKEGNEMIIECLGRMCYFVE